jgi:hypothetical protein
MLFNKESKNSLFEAKIRIGTNQQISLKNSKKQAYLLNGVQVVGGSNPPIPTIFI